MIYDESELTPLPFTKGVGITPPSGLSPQAEASYDELANKRGRTSQEEFDQLLRETAAYTPRAEDAPAAPGGAKLYDESELTPLPMRSTTVEEAAAPLDDRLVLAQQPNAPALDETEDRNWMGTMLRGIGDRGAELVENLVDISGKIGVGLQERFRQGVLAAEELGLPSGVVDALLPAIDTVQSATDAAFEFVEDGPEAFQEWVDYKADATWEKVKEAEGFVDTLISGVEFGIETGAISLVDMGAMIASMPLYAASRIDELADARAENNGRTEANEEDVSIAAIAMVPIIAAEKLALDRLFKGFNGNVVTRVGQGATVEGGQEFLQEGGEYLAEAVGTDTGATAEDWWDRSLAGTIGGAVAGAGITSVKETIKAVAGDTKLPDETDDFLPYNTEGEAADVDATDEEVEALVDPATPEEAEEQAQLEEESAEASPEMSDAEVETALETAGQEEAEAVEEPVKTREENIAEAWRGMGLRKQQLRFVIDNGIMPEDVTATGSAGTITLGDLERAKKAVTGELDDVVEQLEDKPDAKDTPTKRTDGTLTAKAEAAPDTEGPAEPKPVTKIKVKKRPSQKQELTPSEFTPSEEEGPVQGVQGEQQDSTTKAVAEPKFANATGKQLYEESGLTPEDVRDLPRNKKGHVLVGDIRTLVDERTKNKTAEARRHLPEGQRALLTIDDDAPLKSPEQRKESGRPYQRSGGLKRHISAVSELANVLSVLAKRPNIDSRLKKQALKFSSNNKNLSERAQEVVTVAGERGQHTAAQRGRGKLTTAKLEKLIAEATVLVDAIEGRVSDDVYRGLSEELKEQREAETELAEAERQAELTETTTTSEEEKAKAKKKATEAASRAKRVVKKSKAAEALRALGVDTTPAGIEASAEDIGTEYKKLEARAKKLAGVLEKALKLPPKHPTRVQVEAAAAELEKDLADFEQRRDARTQLLEEYAEYDDLPESVILPQDVQAGSIGETLEVVLQEEATTDLPTQGQADTTVEVDTGIEGDASLTEEEREVALAAEEFAEAAVDVESTALDYTDGAQGTESTTVMMSDEYDVNEDYAPKPVRGVTRLENLLSKKWEAVMKKVEERHRKQNARAGAALFKYMRQFPDDHQFAASEWLRVINQNTPKGSVTNLLSGMMLELAPSAMANLTVFRGKMRSVGGVHEVLLDRDGNGTSTLTGDTPNVYINDSMSPAQVVSVFMHEMVHHHTIANLTVNSQAAMDLENLRQEVIRNLESTFGPDFLHEDLNGGVVYGLTNVNEFIAEALTNPSFQALLNEVVITTGAKYTGGSTKFKKLATAWEALTSIIADTFMGSRLHGTNAKEATALSEVLGVGAQLLHTGMRYQDGAQWETPNKPHIKTLSYDRIDESGRRQSRRMMEEDFGPMGRDIYDSVDRTMYGTDEKLLKAAVDIGGERGASIIGKTLRSLRGLKPREAKRQSRAAMLALSTHDQIVRAYKNLFPSRELEKYDSVRREENRIAREIQRQAAPIDEMWEKVEKAGNSKRFSDFRNRATMWEVHPDVPWGKQKHLFKASEQKQVEEAHKQLQKEWRSKSMTKEERDLFRAERKFHQNTRQRLIRANVRRVMQVIGVGQDVQDQVMKDLSDMRWSMRHYDPIRHAGLRDLKAHSKSTKAALDTIERLSAVYRERGPYFPLRRFGDHVVEYLKIIRSQPFETKKEARAHIKAWEAQHPGNNSGKKQDRATIETTADGKFVAVMPERGVEFFESEDEAKASFDSLNGSGEYKEVRYSPKEDPKGMLDPSAAKVIAKAKQSALPDDAGTRSKMSKAEIAAGELAAKEMETAFINLLADSSMRKSEMRRHNIRGASLDGRRVFAEKAYAGAFSIAGMTKAQERADAMSDMGKAVRNAGDFDKAAKMGAVFREMQLRENADMKIKAGKIGDKAVQAVSQLGYFTFLTSPSYSMVNMTQPMMVGLPWLGGRYGFKANKAFGRNWALAMKAVAGELKDAKGGWKRDPHEAINAVIKQYGEGTEAAKVVKHLEDMGLIESTMTQQIIDVGRDTTGWLRSPAGRLSTATPQAVEILNRVTMGVTAFELEKAKSGSVEKALEAASEAVLQTQFDYSDFNKPRWFKANNFVRPFMMFKMYPQGIYALMMQSLHDSKNSKEARRTLYGLIGAHTVAAGALGGIFMEPVRLALGLLEHINPLDDDEEQMFPMFDKAQFDRNVRRAIFEAVNGDEFWSEILARGIGRSVGVELASRIGLNNLMFMGIDETGYLPMQWQFIEQLGGAPLGMVGNAARGWEYIQRGDMVRGVEAMSPKFLRDAFSAARHATEGATSFKGQQYLAPEEIPAHELWVKGLLGFQSGTIAERGEERRAQQSTDKLLTARRDVLLDRLMREDLSREEMRQWNRKHPGYAITMLDKHRRYMRQRQDEAKMRKGYPFDPRKREVSEAGNM